MSALHIFLAIRLIQLKAKLCVFMYMCFRNLPGVEHKSKSIWGRLTLCGVFNTLFLQGLHSLCASSTLKYTHWRINGRVSVHINAHTHTYTSSGAGAGQAEWNYQAGPWALSSNFRRKQILDATVISPPSTQTRRAADIFVLFQWAHLQVIYAPVPLSFTS